ncbi:MAG: hypothetical protein OXH19_05760 [Chloroflexi bacterium]|nr:hypothetical protein [Chloroflexota bacterium]MCY3587598.1 hypothetical protein [Chloroflexota bacterium]MCY3685743.1 hypothetical protein [Chloroflexota bacterium]MDE2708036.1 hypothetical protein [Chloroflexota bacterium]
MDGVSERRANQVLHALREQGLIQREELGYLLSDAGLTALARRDRAAVGPTLDRWTPVRDEQGYIGSLVQTAANQHRYQAGVTEFCARLSAEAARSPDHELLDLLPTQRSQISYELQWTRYQLYPDASFQRSYQGDWHWCLVDFERRAVTPRLVPERLRAYRRYFGSDYVRPDHGGQLPLVLFVFETERAEATFFDTAEQVSHVPFVSSNQPTLTKEGVLGPSWRLPPPHPADRVPLHAVPTIQRHVQTSHRPGPSGSCRGHPRPAPRRHRSSPGRPFCAGLPAYTGPACRVFVPRPFPSAPLSAAVGKLLQNSRLWLRADEFSPPQRGDHLASHRVAATSVVQHPAYRPQDADALAGSGPRNLSMPRRLSEGHVGFHVH